MKNEIYQYLTVEQLLHDKSKNDSLIPHSHLLGHMNLNRYIYVRTLKVRSMGGHDHRDTFYKTIHIPIVDTYIDVLPKLPYWRYLCHPKTNHKIGIIVFKGLVHTDPLGESAKHPVQFGWSLFNSSEPFATKFHVNFGIALANSRFRPLRDVLPSPILPSDIPHSVLSQLDAHYLAYKTWLDNSPLARKFALGSSHSTNSDKSSNTTPLSDVPHLGKLLKTLINSDDISIDDLDSLIVPPQISIPPNTLENQILHKLKLLKKIKIHRDFINKTVSYARFDIHYQSDVYQFLYHDGQVYILEVSSGFKPDEIIVRHLYHIGYYHSQHTDQLTFTPKDASITHKLNVLLNATIKCGSIGPYLTDFSIDYPVNTDKHLAVYKYALNKYRSDGADTLLSVPSHKLEKSEFDASETSPSVDNAATIFKQHHIQWLRDHPEYARFDITYRNETFYFMYHKTQVYLINIVNPAIIRHCGGYQYASGDPEISHLIFKPADSLPARYRTILSMTIDETTLCSMQSNGFTIQYPLAPLAQVNVWRGFLNRFLVDNRVLTVLKDECNATANTLPSSVNKFIKYVLSNPAYSRFNIKYKHQSYSFMLHKTQLYVTDSLDYRILYFVGHYRQEGGRVRFIPSHAHNLPFCISLLQACIGVVTKDIISFDSIAIDYLTYRSSHFAIRRWRDALRTYHADKSAIQAINKVVISRKSGKSAGKGKSKKRKG